MTSPDQSHSCKNSNMSNFISPFALFVTVCLLSSSVLVLRFKHDLRFDKTIDPDYYWRFPLMSKIVSIIKLIAKYFVLGCILSLAFIFIWNIFAAQVGGPLFPTLNFSELQWEKLKNRGWFWNINSSLVLLLALNDVRRCWRAPIWDVFISYKSENIDMARLVADQLIRSGVKVWFAEYQVLLQNYEKFQEAINYGLKNCAGGIVFTNNKYADSEYCQIEIEQLLKRHKPEKVLEIMLPKEDLPHKYYKELENCPSYDGSDIGGILTFIQENTGWPLKSSFALVSGSVCVSYETVCLRRPVVLDITDWDLTNEGKVDLDGNIGGLRFSYQHRRDQYQLSVNLFCGRELSRAGQRQDKETNDRELYKYLIKFAPRHIGRFNAKTRGLHLLFHGGFSQMALTYWMKSYWTRKYSVIIPNQTSKEMAEFVFTFGFLGSFKDYCGNTHVMDHFVKSLQWN